MNDAMTALMAEIAHVGGAGQPLFTKPDVQPRTERQVQSRRAAVPPPRSLSNTNGGNGVNGSVTYTSSASPGVNLLIEWENGFIISGIDHVDTGDPGFNISMV